MLGRLKNLLKQWIEMVMNYIGTVSASAIFAKSDAKITAGMFIATEIWKLMNEERFGERLSSSEKEALYQFCVVIKICFGNKSSS